VTILIGLVQAQHLPGACGSQAHAQAARQDARELQVKEADATQGDRDRQKLGHGGRSCRGRGR
jgi:hypothetical protein